MTHPSYFSLDAYVLAPQTGEVEAHLKTCAQCQAHVCALQVTTALPSALEGLQREAPKAAPWWRFVMLGLVAAALMLSLAHFTLRTPPPRYTAKGTPTAALWLNRDGKVIAWNGQAVRAGDSVRIEVAPAGFTHVTVFDEHTRQVLYEARVPDDAPSLTPAWQLDGEAPSESLRVVLSHGPVDAVALQSSTCTRGADSLCTRFTLTRASP